MYTSIVLGEGKCVLCREVFLIRGVHFREVPLYPPVTRHLGQHIACGGI